MSRSVRISEKSVEEHFDPRIPKIGSDLGWGGDLLPKAVCAAMGLRVTTMLGHGLFGAVYGTEEGFVVKMSADILEVGISEWLRRRQRDRSLNMSPIARAIFPRIETTAVVLRSDVYPYDAALYRRLCDHRASLCITVREGLHPTTEDEKDALREVMPASEAFVCARSREPGSERGEYVRDRMREARDYWRRARARRSKSGRGTDRQSEVVRSKARKLVTILSVASSDYGFFVRDLHAKNIMWRKRQPERGWVDGYPTPALVISDYGMSGTDADEELSELVLSNPPRIPWVKPRTLRL